MVNSIFCRPCRSTVFLLFRILSSHTSFLFFRPKKTRSLLNEKLLFVSEKGGEGGGGRGALRTWRDISRGRDGFLFYFFDGKRGSLYIS